MTTIRDELFELKLSILLFFIIYKKKNNNNKIK